MNKPAEFHLVTVWRIAAPIDVVYRTILLSLDWPQWWRGLLRVEERLPCTGNGLGGVRRYTWQAPCGYRLSFDATLTRIEARKTLEVVTTGDLQGHGRWLFEGDDRTTTCRHEWQVRATPAWIRLLAPIARRHFIRNHRTLMQAGAEGLAARLNARVEVTHGEPGRMTMSHAPPPHTSSKARRS